ncbi:uncharacterized protein LOC111336560 isoform X2 [Stylophora pistillata]|nr:uncharacterized protein LOC111336560 isoform X2 [Stylophora pistillata]
MERVLKGIPTAKSILQKCGTTTRKNFISVKEKPVGHYPDTTAPTKTKPQKSEDDSQFSELFRRFQDVLEQRDIHYLFVNVDCKENQKRRKRRHERQERIKIFHVCKKAMRKLLKV